MHVNSLPKAVTWKRTGRDSNPRPFGSRANALLLRHTGSHNNVENHTNGLHQIFVHVACGRDSVLLRYVMYFRFCGWRHVFIFSHSWIYVPSSVLLRGDRVTAETTASIPTNILLSDEDHHVHIVDCVQGAKSAIFLFYMQEELRTAASEKVRKFHVALTDLMWMNEWMNEKFTTEITEQEWP